MKLALRTLDGKNFIAEVEPEMSVADVKRAIDTQHGMDAARLKLIFQGKVLDDTLAIGTYSIGEGAFVVCMLVKKQYAQFAPEFQESANTHTKNRFLTWAPLPSLQSKPKPADAAPPAAAGAAAVASTPVAPSAAASIAPATAGPTPSPMAPLAAPPAMAPGAVGLDPATVASLVAITGADQAAVRLALQAAFGNADVAVDYLMNGACVFVDPRPPLRARCPCPATCSTLMFSKAFHRMAKTGMKTTKVAKATMTGKGKMSTLGWVDVAEGERLLFTLCHFSGFRFQLSLSLIKILS